VGNEASTFRYSCARFFDVTHTPKNECFFQESNVKLRGTPTMKPEQRAYLDETRDLEMPRQGVSPLNAMLGFFSSHVFFLFSHN
jgi:hypothetical protein